MEEGDGSHEVRGVPPLATLMNRLACEKRLVEPGHDTVRDLQQRNTALQAELAEARAEGVRKEALLESVAHTAEQEIARLVGQLRRCEAAIGSLTASAEQRRKEEDREKERPTSVEILQKENKRLKESSMVLIEEATMAAEERKELQNTISCGEASRTEEATRLVLRLEAAQFLLEARTEEVDKLAAELEPLGEQLGRRTQEVGELGRQLQEAGVVEKELRTKVSTLEDTITHMAEARPEVVSSSHTENDTTTLLRRRIAERDAHIVSLREDLSSSTAQCRQLSLMHVEALQRCRDSEAVSDTLRRRCNTLSDSHASLKEMCAALQERGVSTPEATDNVLQRVQSMQGLGSEDAASSLSSLSGSERNGVGTLHSQLASLQADAVVVKLGLDVGDTLMNVGLGDAMVHRSVPCLQVTKGAYAHRSGLRTGDTLLSVAGTAVNTAAQTRAVLLEALQGGVPSVSVVCMRKKVEGGGVLRGQREVAVELQLTERHEG